MLEKTRVLIVPSSLLNHDGLTKIEMDIIDNFNSKMSFSLACVDGFDDCFEELLKNKVNNLYRLPKQKHVFAYCKELTRIIKKEKFDIVYIHGNSAMMILQVLPAKLGRATKIVTHCHNTKSDFAIIHYLIKPLFNLLVDQKIGCSKYAAKWAYFGKNIKVIDNGINVEKVRFNEKKRNEIRKELGWNDKFIIGHVGRLNVQKNHSMLIDIFNEYYNKNKEARLLLIGNGELKEAVINKIKKYELKDVCMMIDYTDVVENYYQAMDLMVMPSIHEGLCLVALEAQANGLRLIISNVCTPETKIVPETLMLPLDAGAFKWAEQISKIDSFEHKNNYEKIKDTWVDENCMMQQIYQVLNG